LAGIALLLFFEDFKAGALEACAFAADPLAGETLAAPALLADALEADAFEVEAFKAGALEAEALEAGALAAVRVTLAEVCERFFAAPRPAAEARLAPFDETLVLRVFCDTACAWNRHAPVRCFSGTRPGPQIGMPSCRMCQI
jgi:hypothetical protein